VLNAPQDFRSSDGLYNLVKERYPHAVLKGRDLFCSSLFRDATSTSVFYTFIAQLKRSIDDAQPGPTHRFLRTLDQKGRLLRSYTQNIDGFEDRLGLAGPSRDGKPAGATAKGKGKLRTKDVRNVQLHGDIHRVRCTLCAADMPCTSVHLDVFDAGGAPDCPECAQRCTSRCRLAA
jgi:NAD-dependent histone deacetylase SIR2